MPETIIKQSSPKTVAPTEFKFDKQALLLHIVGIQKELEQYQGKEGYNPYLWIHKHITPLVTRLLSNETLTSEEQKKLYDDVMSLPLKPDVKAGPGPDKPLPPVIQ